MGLDWRPLNKPKPGFERRFAQIFRIIQGTEEQAKLSLWERLKGHRVLTAVELLNEFHDISVQAYETIRAPRVGVNADADDWIRARYQESDKILSEEQFVQGFVGYYVIALAEEKEGIPHYIAPTGDAHFFRAQFLVDCEQELGAELLAGAWVSKLSDEAHDYALRLLNVADTLAHTHGLLHLKEVDQLADWEEGSMESKVHIMYSAAKWLLFYSSQGHGFEADF